MRKDMSKVVIERPRSGHSWPNAKTKLRVRRDDEEDCDVMPSRISGSRSKYLHCSPIKYFSDLLGPLKKYLRKQVGRPWDAVYSEIAQTLDRRKVTGQHIFDHVEGEVELHAEVDENGVAFYRGYAGIYRVRGLYVHPRTGLLCWQESSYGKYVPRRAELQQQRRTIERKPINFDQSYLRLNGVWYVADFVADEERKPPDDGKPCEDGMSYFDGKRWMRLIGKRKCSQQELQKAGLRNANPAFRVLM